MPLFVHVRNGLAYLLGAVVVRPFPTNGDSHRTKHLHLKDEPLRKSHRKPALRLPKRRGGTCHVMTSVCFQGVSLVSPVNLNPRTMNAVIMCCDRDPDPPNSLESDGVTFFKLEAVLLTCRDGGCFPGESSLKSRSGGLTIAVIYFHHKHLLS